MPSHPDRVRRNYGTLLTEGWSSDQRPTLTIGAEGDIIEIGNDRYRIGPIVHEKGIQAARLIPIPPDPSKTIRLTPEDIARARRIDSPSRG